MGEPKRNSSLDSLEPYVADRVRAIIKDMEGLGFDPIVFEARRTQGRQNYLYSIGRTRQKSRKPVTWTLVSRHLTGKAVDIISKSRGWLHPTFYHTLKAVAKKHGMHALRVEKCHLEWR